MHKSHKKKKQRNRQKKSQTIEKEENVAPKQEDLCDESRNGTYLIRQSDILGRYTVAAKDLHPGDLIIRENPLIVGPCPSGSPVCLNCHQNLLSVNEPYPCPGCRWPLCQQNCPGCWHSSEECKILSKSSAKITDEAYSAISSLRCLLLTEMCPAKWKVVMKMESHDEGRRRCKERWEEEGQEIVKRIREEWQMNEISENEIRKICGILQVNSFEVGRNGSSILALYPRAYLLSHDCTPNTTHTDDDHTYCISIRAATLIPSGKPITLSYTYTLQGTAYRRQHLHQGKFFWCQCLRCTDPTELDTHASSLRCPKCREGWVIPKEPLNEDTAWLCTNNKCEGYVISSKTVKTLMEKIADEVDSIDANDVTSYETFLERYRNVLHPQHFHFIGVKHSLSQLYGRAGDHLIHQLSPFLLQRKVLLCRELLTVFDKLEPGYSRLRGTTLYELHAPLMILATRDYEIKLISKHELRSRLLEVVHCLKESSIILGLEPDNSQEKIMACAAKEALNKIRDWEKILGKIY